jgi:hypothetical protein
VNSTERSAWCEANINTCVNLCGGQAGIANNGNECDDVRFCSAQPSAYANPHAVHAPIHLQVPERYLLRRCLDGSL